MQNANNVLEKTRHKLSLINIKTIKKNFLLYNVGLLINLTKYTYTV